MLLGELPFEPFVSLCGLGLGAQTVAEPQQVTPFGVCALEHMQMVCSLRIRSLYKIMPAGNPLLAAKGVAKPLQPRDEREGCVKVFYGNADV